MIENSTLVQYFLNKGETEKAKAIRNLEEERDDWAAKALSATAFVPGETLVGDIKKIYEEARELITDRSRLIGQVAALEIRLNGAETERMRTDLQTALWRHPDGDLTAVPPSAWGAIG